MTELVTTERMATGGEAVARLDDGRVVFVRGATAGELVRVEVTERRKRFARAVAVEVVEASPDRAPLTCDHARAECGGCDWLHIAPDAQRRHKHAIVADQLRRLGGVVDPLVALHESPAGRRTTVRCAIVDGRAGYRARKSNDMFAAASCQAAHPLIEDLIVEGRYGRATEVSLRCAPSTGERLASVTGPVDGVRLPSDVVVCAAGDERGPAIHHDIGGRRWRVSAGSFFQTSHLGAEALVSAVRDALGDSDGAVVDLYGGVGLLGGAAAPDRLAAVVESNPSACADARHNLAHADPEVDVVEQRVERWKPPRRFPTVIADPARAGLGARGVAVVEACQADALVLVSCDPASLGRDVGLLRESGWTLDHSTIVDMFADTSRIEVVSRLSR